MEGVSPRFMLKPKVMHKFCELERGSEKWFEDHYAPFLVQNFPAIVSWDTCYVSWFSIEYPFKHSNFYKQGFLMMYLLL